MNDLKLYHWWGDSNVHIIIVFRFYDTSKQAVGAVVIHFANVVLAGQFSGDPCTW